MLTIGRVWNWYGYRTSGHKTGLSRAAWDILEQGIQKTKQRACELASQIHPIVCDVANESEVLKAMRKTEAIGKPHLLANNAGPVAIGKDSRFIAPTTAAFGMIHYVTTAFPETKPVKGSSIVNIASIVGPVFGGGREPLSNVLMPTLT